jgi:hypothetical protein
MSTSISESTSALSQQVMVTDDALTVDLRDGRSISVPLVWYPRLFHAAPSERAHGRLIGDGQGIHRPELNEDISVGGLLSGKPSGESQPSLKQWHESRQASSGNRG